MPVFVDRTTTQVQDLSRMSWFLHLAKRSATCLRQRGVAGLLTLLMACGWAFAARRTGYWLTVNAQKSESAASDLASSQGAVLTKYCVGCHNQRLRTAGLALDTLSTSSVGPNAEVWEKVVRKLRMGAMPPPGAPRPDKPAGDGLMSGLEAALDEAAARNPNPGRTDTLHRLNRAEYQNAIRDLLALAVDPGA